MTIPEDGYLLRIFIGESDKHEGVDGHVKPRDFDALLSACLPAPVATSKSPTCGRVKLLHPAGSGTMGS